MIRWSTDLMIWWSIDPQIWWSDDLMIWRSYDLMIYRPNVLVIYWSTALTGALELSTHDSLGRSPIGEHVWRFTGARTLAPLDLLPLIKNIVFMVFAWSLNISHVRLVTAPAKTIVSSHIINSRHFVPPLLTAGEASAAFSPTWKTQEASPLRFPPLGKRRRKRWPCRPARLRPFRHTARRPRTGGELGIKAGV